MAAGGLGSDETITMEVYSGASLNDIKVVFGPSGLIFESPLKTPIFKKIGQLGEISINKNNDLQR